MRITKYRNILWGVATRMGMDPESALNANDARAINEYINLAYKLAWQRYPWAETIQVETRAATGQIIPISGAGLTTIGELFSVTELDPELYDVPGDIGFRMTSRGIVIAADHADTEPYLRYRPMPPEFTSEEWAIGSYAIGDVVYYPTTGHCYRCIDTATTEPPTDTDHWEVLGVAAILAEAVKAGAYAATLAEEGQHSTAALAGGAMEELLAGEIDLAESQTLPNQNLRVLTRTPP